MIIYEPNKHFFGDLFYFAKSLVMVRLTFAVLGIGIFTAIFAFVLSYFHIEDYLPENLGTIFSFLGVVLSILLVFRTNSAYDRWWEGRKLWGSLVNNCRNLAVVTHSFLPKSDRENRHRMALLISNFCIALKDYLRNGTDVNTLMQLSEAEKNELASKKNIPNEISSQIHQLLVECRRKGTISDYDLLNFKPHTQSLLDISGACERIKKTPIPFSYEIFIKMYVLIYCFLLPVTMVPLFGYLAIPFVMLVFFAFMGLEMMAAEIEDPFGFDANDLPTGKIAKTISDDVFEILEATKSNSEEETLYEVVN
jgi:putative membrane protein